MRPLLITVGSRGDVQPYLALARGLLAAGHRPLLAAPRRFAPLTAHRADVVVYHPKSLGGPYVA
ncbi:glycosyltransferase [Nonomuraea sp. NPDC052265]|uniref:glycosyltransferase n=1 Tax=Nonomuraea sp. NPDC052265 TaxID=3364374 RepID=UPI0037C54A7F